MKATKQYFPVVLFIMLYKVVLTFESVDEILKCDHSNESYWAVRSCGTVYYAVRDGSNFEFVNEILKYDNSNESYWAMYFKYALICMFVFTHFQKLTFFFLSFPSWVLPVRHCSYKFRRLALPQSLPVWWKHLILLKESQWTCQNKGFTLV